MALMFRSIWMAINKALTIINSTLLGIILGNTLYNYEKKKYVKVPLMANIALLVVLGIIAGAYFYKFFIA